MGDFLITEEINIIDTKIRNIKLRKNQTVNHLLFAIGDDFGVTEKGILYAKESYIRKGLFQSLICQQLVVDHSAIIKGSLTVKGDLYIEGNLKVEGSIVVKENLEVYKKMVVHETAYFENIILDGVFHANRGAILETDEHSKDFDGIIM